MNFNRIFDNSTGEYGEDGEISLSREYKNSEGNVYSSIRPVHPRNAWIITLYGFPFTICKSGDITINGDVLSKQICYIYGLTDAELGEYSIPDYTKLMNFIMDSFNQTES